MFIDLQDIIQPCAEQQQENRLIFWYIEPVAPSEILQTTNKK